MPALLNVVVWYKIEETTPLLVFTWGCREARVYAYERSRPVSSAASRAAVRALLVNTGAKVARVFALLNVVVW